MLPNEKQLKSLMNKIKKNAEKKYEQKQSVKTAEIQEPTEDTQLFNEMKKLPFTE
jgi:hypothetical protein